MKNLFSKETLERIRQAILGDLWENSVFDNRSFDLVQTIMAEQAKSENPEDQNSLDIPSHETAQEASTIRNRNLISAEKQDILRKTTVAFFGLSVGSHAAVTWMMESRADTIKIVDPDIVAPSNLNRLRFSWDTVGREKVEIVKRQLEGINPYATIISTNKTGKDIMENMLDNKPEVSVIVDAIDDMQGKIFLREFAKERKIPLVSAADVGDNVVLDIERYDLSPQPEYFLGRIPNMDHIDFASLSDNERRSLIIKLVGFEENSEELLDSLLQIGKKLTTWPQLGATATIAGGIVATSIKKIVLGEDIRSGRYYFSLDSLLVEDFNSKENIEKRKEKIKQVKDKFKIT